MSITTRSCQSGMADENPRSPWSAAWATWRSPLGSGRKHNKPPGRRNCPNDHQGPTPAGAGAATVGQSAPRNPTKDTPMKKARNRRRANRLRSALR